MATYRNAKVLMMNMRTNRCDQVRILRFVRMDDRGIVVLDPDDGQRYYVPFGRVLRLG